MRLPGSVLSMASAFLLSGCAGSGIEAMGLFSRGAAPDEAPVEETETDAAPDIAALAMFSRSVYEDFERDALELGLLREEANPEDAPYTNAELARNFLSIAFRVEPFQDGERVLSEGRDAPLRRWEGPVRYAFIGEHATEDDRAFMKAFAIRLVGLTALDIREAVDPDAANIHITFMDAEDRVDAAREDTLAELGGGEVLDVWLKRLDWPCIGGISGRRDGVITEANILIKNEMPVRLRESCLTEEFTQGLGLTNDDPTARPSIFNDDQEFAALTEHDENLLRLLYDTRLKTGIRASDAEPIIAGIIKELRPQDAIAPEEETAIAAATGTGEGL